MVVVATSNTAPDRLYLNGLNRPYFLPFIALLHERFAVHSMDSAVDHRQLAAATGDSETYFSGPGATERFEAAWQSAAAAGATPASLPVGGGSRRQAAAGGGGTP
eukprot:SAG22_NODE_5146_length_1077_cov_1.284254_1_plen_104_part_10